MCENLKTSSQNSKFLCHQNKHFEFIFCPIQVTRRCSTFCCKNKSSKIFLRTDLGYCCKWWHFQNTFSIMCQTFIYFSYHRHQFREFTVVDKCLYSILKSIWNINIWNIYCQDRAWWQEWKWNQDKRKINKYTLIRKRNLLQTWHVW